jgi:hypothetical protein
MARPASKQQKTLEQTLWEAKAVELVLEQAELFATGEADS